jgi:Protein of unknown function (DUF2974).
MNILDYLEMRGDLTFYERPFNEVDNLVFSVLAYLDMKDIVPGEFDFTVSLKKLCKKYLELGYDQSYIVNDPKILLKRIVSCKRYERVRVGGYYHNVSQDEQVQFSCATFMLGDGTAYVGFSGTDDTLAGWREDFNFTFMSSTPGQNDAAAYLNRLGKATFCPLRIGGHSKGGNFAVYGAAFCDEHLRDSRIIGVYSNDGPGFRKAVAESEQYLAIVDRTLKIIPESSIVGILLSGNVRTKVVRSTAKGISQHGFYTWKVRRDRFFEADSLSTSSTFMDETVKRWLDSLEDEQKKAVVSAVFDALQASGATTLTQLNTNKWVSYNAILKAARNIDPSVYSDIADSLKKLAGAGKDVLWNEAKKTFERRETPDPEEEE